MDRRLRCKKTVASLLVLIASSVLAGDLTGRIAATYRVLKTDEWFGGRRTVFDFEGYDAWVVEPPADVAAKDGRPWTWTLQWRQYFTVETCVPRLLKTGWHHAAIDTFRHHMDETGLKVNKSFRDFLVNDLGFNAKANLIGMSWGGFFAVRYAAAHPSDVAKMYLDAPLLNFEGFKSVPGDWQATEPEKGWKSDPRMPVNMAKTLADTDIKMLVLYGGKDDVVPPTYNCNRFAVFYKSAGGNPENLRMIGEPSRGHHPHGVKADDDTIVNFFTGSGDSVIPEYRAHLARAGKWYLPSRLGAFFHWGLFTGGGCRAKTAYAKPLTYPTPADFEAAAPDPHAVARNFAASAKSMGAKYTILTLWHTCGGHMMLYPTKVEGFRNKTTIDYIGPYLDEAKKAGLHAMVYFPTDSNNWDFDPENPTVDPAVADYRTEAFADFVSRTLDELSARYGSRIEGFWVDGGFPGHTWKLCGKIRTLWPEAVIIGNNITDFRVDVDVSTTEVCPDKIAQPAYCRPDAYRSVGSFGSAIAQRDLNEDTPTIGGWWYSRERGKEYDLVRDPRLLVKRVVSSLGQRGRWNCTIGVGPTIDGTLPKYTKPIVDNLRGFLAWAGPAIYNTKGPAGSFFDPGYAGALNGGTCAAFYSVTQSLSDPSVFYAIVTETNFEKGKRERNTSIFQTNGHRPRRVTDLHTGRSYAFTAPHGVRIDGIDWSDIEKYGATVLKFEF